MTNGNRFVKTNCCQTLGLLMTCDLRRDQHPLTKSDSNAFNHQLSKNQLSFSFLWRLALTFARVYNFWLNWQEIYCSDLVDLLHRFISNLFRAVLWELLMKDGWNILQPIICGWSFQIFGVRRVLKNDMKQKFSSFILGSCKHKKYILSPGLSLYKTC